MLRHCNVKSSNPHLQNFLDTQVSLAPTHVSPLVRPSVGDTFEFPFYQHPWTVTERPQRLVTFETFDQSDEAK